MIDSTHYAAMTTTERGTRQNKKIFEICIVYVQFTYVDDVAYQFLCGKTALCLSVVNEFAQIKYKMRLTGIALLQTHRSHV